MMVLIYVYLWRFFKEEMRDSSKQPPIESYVLEHELHHVRDHVLVEKVSRQRAARNNSGNDDAFFG